MGKRTLVYTAIHRVCTTVYRHDDTRILWGKLSYRCRHGNLWVSMGLSDTLIKWQNKHRVVVISVCYLSILFFQIPWQFIRIVYNSNVLWQQSDSVIRYNTQSCPYSQSSVTLTEQRLQRCPWQVLQSCVYCKYS